MRIDAEERPATPFGVAFRDGLCCNLLNPKVALFILSVFSQCLDPDALLAIRALFGLALVVEALLVWVFFSMLLDRPAFRNHYERYQN